MLKKSHRLAKTKDVQKTFARGRSFFNPFFTIKFLRGTGYPRFTVVVSTKVAKKAVTRNRLKRILREVIRKNLSVYDPGNYAVVVKPKALVIKEKDLLVAFIDLLTKIK